MTPLKIIGWTFIILPILACFIIFLNNQNFKKNPIRQFKSWKGQDGERNVKPIFGYLFVLGFICLVFGYFS